MVTKTDQAILRPALGRTFFLTYNALEERRKRENLLANGHRDPSPRTDIDANGDSH